MTAARWLALCAVALAAGASCTRVFDAVTPGGVCTQQSTDPDCAPTPWPNSANHKNSDPWLITHNQVISSMAPNVLVLNFDNGQTSADTLAYAKQVAAALAAGSQYHAYANPAAPPFLNYNVLKVVDLTDSMTGPSVNSNVPVNSAGDFDPTALFNSTQFVQAYGYPDSNAPGGFQSLCQLFENGTINEVWIQDGGATTLPNGTVLPRAPLYAESRMIYDENGAATGMFSSVCIGAGSSLSQSCLNVPCSVTVRLSHLDPSMYGGPGCDVLVRGWGIDGMWSALPSELAVDANAFLNQDFRTRFNVGFNSWSEICTVSPCVDYPGPMEARSTSGDTAVFDINPFLQGCGSSQFPSNGTQPDDFQNTNAVNSRCAGFGLRGGANGADDYQPYSYDTLVSSYDQTYRGTSQCSVGWQIYWRQSMPGYQNQAIAADGTPMKNWWPILFY